MIRLSGKRLPYSIRGRASANIIMSLELGVVLASLTDRVLVLKRNAPPLANLVEYPGIIRNTYPSRVTDLIDP